MVSLDHTPIRPIIWLAHRFLWARSQFIFTVNTANATAKVTKPSEERHGDVPVSD